MLSFQDKKRLDELNARNGYGLSKTALILLVKEHQRSRIQQNQHGMEAIEYRLTDCNFHAECSALKNGDYDEALHFASLM
jgi:HEAT repeat protein